MTGSTVSHYIIREKLGDGGMGVVYKAHDTRLDRVVALKFLPEALSGDPHALERLRREARTASALNHPNICTIHDIDEHERGAFIAMEWLDGQTLKSLIGSRPLDPDRAIEIALEISGALEAAHAQGIIHRDIKPANIFITRRGTVKVLDFGLAKRVAERQPDPAAPTETVAQEEDPLSSPGSAAGTVAYMSPEQALGQDLDGRTDIFSLGVVLYQMVTGRLPFAANNSAALFDAILHKDPVPPVRLNPEVPSGLDRIIEKALEKDRRLRYQSAAELRVDLARVKRDTESGRSAATASPMRNGRARMRRWILAACMLILIFAAIGAWWRSRERAALSRQRQALAVLYFTNLTQDPTLNWLDRGLTDMLTTNLGQIKGIDLLSAERVSEVLQKMGRKDSNVEAGLALEVVRRAGADTFITGSLLRIGPSRLRLQVLGQSSSGEVLFTEKLEAQDLQGVFAMVDSLTARVAQRFVPADRLPEKAPAIEEVSTSNLEAYRHYQSGRNYLMRVLFSDAVRELEEAVRLDPQFALAYRDLSWASRLTRDFRRWEEASRKLDELRWRLPRKDRLAYEADKADWARDWRGALAAREKQIVEYPRESEARIMVGMTYIGLDQADRAVRLTREGLQLDPEDNALWNQLCYAEAAAGHLEAALSATDRYRTLLPGDPNPLDTRGDVLFQFGRHDEAIAAYRNVIELRPDFNSYRTHAKIAAVYADQGKHKQAEVAFREYASQARGVERFYIPLSEAQLLWARGSIERALEKYRQSVTELAKAGQAQAAGSALELLAANAVLVQQPADALAFTRRQDLAGREYRSIAVLEASLGNESAAENAVNRYAAAITRTSGGREPSPDLLEDLRMEGQIARAMNRDDAPAMAAAAARSLRLPLARFARGRASLLLRDYASAERWFQSTLARERGKLGDPRASRLPLLTALCHFYLGQVHEGAGRPEQAKAEYRDFLSRFENPLARLAQVSEARAALKRLEH